MFASVCIKLTLWTKVQILTTNYEIFLKHTRGHISELEGVRREGVPYHKLDGVALFMTYQPICRKLQTG